jgi:diadenosine tetraphosphate (Ap4A) HIT family hydrolase
MKRPVRHNAKAMCELCDTPGGEILWQDSRCRVVLVDEPGYPGFCRVIWGAHVKEMTELTPGDREHFMRVVFALEAALRELMQPEKINLASLGNVVPHLHWHVIPRYRDDPHFPAPIWAEARRPIAVRPGPENNVIKLALERRLQTP